MKPSIIFGVLILAVVVAAAILAPQFRSAEAKSAVAAERSATLAQRLLGRYDYHLPHLARTAAPDALGDAELDADALRGYRQLIQENRQLLQQAAQEARTARSTNANVVGVPHVAGEVAYTEAATAYDEAHALRQRQVQLQSRLLILASHAAALRARENYAETVDVQQTLDQLRDDLEDLLQRHAETEDEAAELAERVETAEAELADVQQQQQQLQQELLRLEQRGFTVGDDASFEQFRQRYRELADRQAELQRREQWLQRGGLRDATFRGRDLLTADLEGGERFAGLEVLRARLDARREKARRLKDGAAALEEQMKFVERLAGDTRDSAARTAELTRDVLALEAELAPQIAEFADLAGQAEERAVRAARDAANAFRASQQSVEQWIRAARQTQSELDPQRQNPRLAMILGDKALPLVGDSGQAAALLLTGRIHLERIRGRTSYEQDMAIASELSPGFEAPAPEAEEPLVDIRQAASEAAQQALEIYQRLVQKAPSETQWIPQAGVAAAAHLLARINPTEADTYLVSAVDAIEQSVGEREQSPYVEKLVPYRRHLRARTGRTGAPGDELPPAEEAVESPDEPADEE